MKKSANAGLFALALVAFVVGQSAFIVPETQQIMVLEFGKPVARYTEPGLKFKIPFIQQIRVFDRRVLDVDPPAEEIILADRKRVVVDAFARYKVNDMLAFSNSLQTEQQAASRLSNIINSTLRSALGTATLADILSEKRDTLMSSIQDQVNTAVSRFGIEIVDVRIGRADLPEQTSQSIFARMRTEREREAAEFRAQGQEEAQQIRSKADKERTVLLADAEKKSQIMRGEGDQKAVQIYADAFKRDPEFYAFYRSMEAYRNSVSGEGTTLILKPDSDFFRFFNNMDGRR